MLLSHHHLGPQFIDNHQNAQKQGNAKWVKQKLIFRFIGGERELKNQEKDYPVNLPDMNYIFESCSGKKTEGRTRV